MKKEVIEIENCSDCLFYRCNINACDLGYMHISIDVKKKVDKNCPLKENEYVFKLTKKEL